MPAMSAAVVARIAPTTATATTPAAFPLKLPLHVQGRPQTLRGTLLAHDTADAG